MTDTYLKQENEGKKLIIKYKIKGISSLEGVEGLLDKLASALDECEISIDASLTCLDICCADERESEISERAEGILYTSKIQFMRDDECAIQIKSEKKPRAVSLFAAICLTLTAIVISALATFAICKISEPPKLMPEIPEDTESSTPEYIVEDVPKYFEDLVILDEIFNQYSFDGIDGDKMAEAILDAYIAATGDVYAEYFNAEEFEAYMEDRSGEFVGIGISIVNSEIEIDGIKYKTLQVISVFRGSPAIESGVMPGDHIMYVESEGELKLVQSLGYTNALDSMLGEKGTTAKFVVFREDGSDYKEITFEIARRTVESESVSYKVSGTDSEVGIISITGFDLTTPTQFKNAVNTLRDVYKCKYFVFDLRNNPGGSLDSIETVLSFFLDEGDVIVSTEYSDGSEETMVARVKRYSQEYASLDVKASEIGMYKDLDFIVLTNENTASAAELFTATMRDYSLAKIVGKSTYGKGCMQSIIPLESYGLEGGLKVTVAMYYSASKTVYHGTGIAPDYDIDLSEEAKKINFYTLPEDMDAQMQKAIALLTK